MKKKCYYYQLFKKSPLFEILGYNPQIRLGLVSFERISKYVEFITFQTQTLYINQFVCFSNFYGSVHYYTLLHHHRHLKWFFPSLTFALLFLLLTITFFEAFQDMVFFESDKLEKWPSLCIIYQRFLLVWVFAVKNTFTWYISN